MRIPFFSSFATLANIINGTEKAIGTLQPITGSLVENLDGMAELQFTAAQNERRFSALENNCVLRIEKKGMRSNTTEGIQYYRVYDILNKGNGISTVKARNVTYDLGNYAIKPFNENESLNAFNILNADLQSQGCGVDYICTDSVRGKFRMNRPMTGREIMGGYEGSLKDAFHCEYASYSNHLFCYTNNSLRTDNGVVIAYSKNIISYEHEINYENVYTSVLGYAIINDTCYVGNEYTKIQDAIHKTKIVDFSYNYDEENLPTEASLTTDAENYATANEIEKPRINFTIDFVRLYETDEYKNRNIDYLLLGDVVHVKIPNVNGEVTARVLETTYDIVADRYSKLQIGNYKANFYSSLLSVIDMQIKRN